jgi:hypothetical protein
MPEPFCNTGCHGPGADDLKARIWCPGKAASFTVRHQELPLWMLALEDWFVKGMEKLSY